MSRYHGRQYKGAARDTRAAKKREAELRDVRTVIERRAWYRRGKAKHANENGV